MKCPTCNQEKHYNIQSDEWSCLQCRIDKTMFRPLNDVVIIMPERGEEERNGIIIPATADKKVRQGTVKATGKGKRIKKGAFKGRYAPLSVKPGDKVVFSDWDGLKVDIDGQECLGMREDDIMAVLG